jgi:hypothetical protein
LVNNLGSVIQFLSYERCFVAQTVQQMEWQALIL